MTTSPVARRLDYSETQTAFGEDENSIDQKISPALVASQLNSSSQDFLQHSREYRDFINATPLKVTTKSLAPVSQGILQHCQNNLDSIYANHNLDSIYANPLKVTTESLAPVSQLTLQHCQNNLDSIYANPLKVTTESLAPVSQDKAKYCKNYWLTLSFFPIIGTIPSIASQCTLAGKLKKTSDSKEMIPLLTRINQFKVGSIVRSLLTLAAVISFLAFGIITGGIPLAIGIGLVTATSLLGLGFTVFHSIQFHTNKAELESLKATPPPENLEEKTPPAQV